MYRYVALARALDERMWILNRAGRIPFVICGQGHEGAQVGIAWAFESGHDWIAPFYRSIATCLTFGMSPRDIMTAQYATANDPSSGGRQMPGHYGSHEHNLVSRLVAGRDAAAARGGHRPRRQDPQDRPGRDDQHGRGLVEPGRRPRGPQLRGDPQAAVHLRRREQRLRDQRADGPMQVSVANVADRAAGYGIPGVVVDGTDVLACYAAARDAVARARAGEGPTPDRGQGDPPDRRTRRTTSRRSTAPRRSSRPSASATPLPAFRSQLRDAGVLTDEIEARLAAEIKAAVDEATDYAESQPDPDPVDRACATSMPRTTELMPPRTFIEAIRETLADEMRRDETVIVLGEDVGKKGGVFLATDGLWAEFGDDRVIDTPLTESMIVGASIGAAVNGLRPVAEIQFADFIFPAFNQIVSEAARMRYRSNNGYGVPMVDPGAVRRRRPRRALPLAVASRRSSPTCPGSRWSCRRPRTTPAACSARRSATRIRSCSSSTRRCTARSAATSPTRITSVPLGKAAITHPGLAGHGHRVRADGPLRARGRRPRRRGRASASEVVDLRTLRPLDTRDVLDRSARPASA